ncbi:C-type lectin domain family 2 member B-like [Malaclemys terrapin pileata]|uniref:C-type lectin domain family 2 member B-like n=1 Tax=Malaclemys terrapin pileata TaxID=2991368 RepID=UPI0023A88C67|nr:C-type lectin domain family 2 member B-like [Malaclemys terrapin pileata]
MGSLGSLPRRLLTPESSDSGADSDPAGEPALPGPGLPPGAATHVAVPPARYPDLTGSTGAAAALVPAGQQPQAVPLPSPPRKRGDPRKSCRYLRVSELCSSIWIWKCLACMAMVTVILVTIVLVKISLDLRAIERVPAVTGKCIPCPGGWMWFRGQCYYFSKETQDWDASKEFCSSHNATLAVIKEPSQLETIHSFKGNEDYWLGLSKGGEGWQWVDGSPFTNTIIQLENDAPNLNCAFLSMKQIATVDCTSLRYWICIKESR